MTGAPEVVVIDRPEHDAAEPVLRDVLGLAPCDRLVVVADPLVALVRVRAHRFRVGLHHRPVVAVLQAGADLVVRQVALFACRIALLTGAVGRRTDVGRVRVVQRVGPAVRRYAQYQLFPVGTRLQVELYAVEASSTL